MTRLAEKKLSKLKRKKQKNSDPEASDDEGNHQEDRKFWEKSTWTPPKNRNAAVEAYLKPVELMHGGSPGPPRERTTFYQANDRPSNNYGPV